MSVRISLRGMLRLIRFEILRRVNNVGFLARQLILSNCEEELAYLSILPFQNFLIISILPFQNFLIVSKLPFQNVLIVSILPFQNVLILSILPFQNFTNLINTSVSKLYKYNSRRELPK